MTELLQLWDEYNEYLIVERGDGYSDYSDYLTFENFMEWVRVNSKYKNS